MTPSSEAQMPFIAVEVVVRNDEPVSGGQAGGIAPRDLACG